ncbi:MAG: tRNA (N(6)-L-threonylcarbamoyladenosine(37)-C(2))-methylthiotransferase MtaB [Firmicutes bacterium]|nr:tRNA (N(6)-L-threonylcarbamoyladenosine(37)-C(2))-methylthiotransferase MtaB [[Eubacterium] siraeum]MCM1489198.1 tRNA (N(6)-L-threonylcarbamoyladenosine(37)-C(2))-methylthiotransferase MtaB [Bacillota bacterium]
MNFTVITQGCRVNQYDSGIISQSMIRSGFTPAKEGQMPDIVIVNTCTVTESGDKKGSKIIARLRRDHPDSVIAVTGCFPQAFAQEAAKNQNADIVIGNQDKESIPELVKAFLQSGEKMRQVKENTLDYPEPREFAHSDKTRAYIKIEEGCNRFCSYCIIPTARGRVRSRSLENIAEETEFHARDGHREIVLTGINLSCYGSDIGLSLVDAVRTAAENPLIERVRLSSLEPELLTEDVIRKMAEIKKLCPHFHLSLQSGCTETLKRMNRRYSADEYRQIAERLREFFPNCAVTTDIMVGFAGETDEEFAQSLKFAEEMDFAKIHVFTYSVRPGTAAAKMADQVTEETKNRRYAEMSRLAEESQAKFNRKNIGKTHKVLIERQTSPEFIGGHTENFIPVRIYGGKAQRHDIVGVRITEARKDHCLAIIP